MRWRLGPISLMVERNGTSCISTAGACAVIRLKVDVESIECNVLMCFI